jgi:hypothetical protein
MDANHSASICLCADEPGYTQLMYGAVMYSNGHAGSDINLGGTDWPAAVARLDPPENPLKRGGLDKVPLFKGDLGGSRLGDQPENSHPRSCSTRPK